MGERKENQSFEFLFSINDNIICQRYFSVNNFNINVKNSQTFKDECDNIVEIIKKKVKDISLNHMNDYVYFYAEEPNIYDTNGEYDNFYVYIKYYDKVIYSRIFPAYVYPTRIRKNVDIRNYLSTIINKLQDVLSSKNKDLKFDFNSFYQNPPSYVEFK